MMTQIDAQLTTNQSSVQQLDVFCLQRSTGNMVHIGVAKRGTFLSVCLEACVIFCQDQNLLKCIHVETVILNYLSSSTYHIDLVVILSH